MKRIFTTIIAFSALSVHAQFGSPSYLYNQNILNPAYIALNQSPVVTSSYGSQWFGVSGAPRVFSINASTKIKQNHGLELGFNSHSLGSMSNLLGTIGYAHAWKLIENVKLSLGGRGGLISSSWQLSNVITPPATTMSVRMGAFSGEIGGYLEGRRAFLGISYLASTFSGKRDSVSIHYKNLKMTNFYTGVNFNLSNKLKLTPSFLISIPRGIPIGIDFNLTLNYDEKVKLFSSYNTSKTNNFAVFGTNVFDAFTLGSSIRFFKKLDIGYMRQIGTARLNSSRTLISLSPTTSHFFLRFAPKKNG